MSTPNRHDEPVTRGDERLLRRWTRRLRDSLNVILDEPVVDVPDRESIPEAPSSQTATSAAWQASASGNAVSSPLRETFGSSGPPEAWLKLVREGAPELLLPVEQGGTPWAGIRAFGGQELPADQWIPMISNITVDDVSLSVTPPQQEPLQAVESAPVRRRPSAPPRQEEKTVGKSTLIQTLESTITQVLRRHVRRGRTKEQSNQSERVPATSFTNEHPGIEAASPAYDSSALRFRSIQEQYPTVDSRVSREPERVTLVPKTEIAQGPTVIRKSDLPHQSLPWRSEKSAYPVSNPPVVASGRHSSQVALPSEPPTEKFAVHQSALNRNNVETTRSVSSIAPFVHPEVESVRKAVSVHDLPVRRQQPIFDAGIPTPRAAVAAFSRPEPQPDFPRSQQFSELPQITITASETRATEWWADLPSAVPQSSASVADALRRLDHLRRLDLEQQGGN